MIGGATSLPAITIDVTDSAFATVATGFDLNLHFGVWNYAVHNPGFDPFPVSIGFRVIGPVDPDVRIAVNQNSTTNSLINFEFNAYLESVDGAVSIPSSASVIPAPGNVSIEGGSPVQVAVLSGSFALSFEESHALFGANLANFDDAAVIRLHNTGAPFRIGLGTPYSVQNATSEPGVAGLGPSRTAGIPGRVTLSTPEPATRMLMAAAIALLALYRFSRCNVA